MQTTIIRPTSRPRSPGERLARRGVAVYLGIVIMLSIPLQYGIVASQFFDGEGEGAGAWLVIGLMVVPAAASVIARLVLHEGFADVSFRLGGRTGRIGILVGLAFPIIVGLVAYGFAWITGLADLTPPAIEPWLGLIGVNLVLSLVLVTGEEIGWRGYLVTRLVAGRVPWPLLTSGLIWGLWHVPLLWGGYVQDSPAPLLSAVLIVITATTVGYILARLRLATGSIWPAVALHAAWNTAIQAVFDPATSGVQHALWVGEAGIVTAVTLIIAVVGARLVDRQR